MKIYITRHGETFWNLEGRIQGHMDSKLTPLGEQQALWLGKRLKNTNIDVICTSSSGRALQTTFNIKGDRVIDVESFDEMKELYLGNWEGQFHDDIMMSSPVDYQHLWHEPNLFVVEGKESIPDIIKRAGQFFEEIISKYADKDILLVSHAMWIKGLLCYLKNLPPSEFWSGNFMKSTCLTVVEVKNHQRSILIEGDTTHYEMG